MGKFNEFLDKFGDADLPEGFLSAAMTAYDEDISIPVAKVAQVEKERDDFAVQVNDLKVQNFDLIRSGYGADDGANESGGDKSGQNSDDDGVITIDDLFE